MTDVAAPRAETGQAQFPQLPLQRASDASGASADILAWAAVMVLAALVAGWIWAKRGGGTWRGAALRWNVRRASRDAPTTVARTSLTPAASLHVVEWQGEELLLGCTAQSIAILARRPAASAEDHAAAKGRT